MAKIAVLLVNLGSTEQLTARSLRRFYRQFLGDRRVVGLPRWLWLPILYGIILPFRPRQLLSSYKHIWQENGSPLITGTDSLAKKLQSYLNRESPNTVVVASAMCYSHPHIAAQIDYLQQQRCTKLIVLPLYPQYNCSTTAAVFDKISTALRKLRFIPELHFINHYATHPSYIEAIAAQIRGHWQTVGKSSLLLFSFHGVPQKLIDQGDPYLDHCRQTAKQVTDLLGLSNREWRLVFQSRFGKAQWLEPATSDVIAQLPRQGHTVVDVICPGFAIDCLETLHEISVENGHFFEQAGGKSLRYIPALNDSDLHCHLLASLCLPLLAQHEKESDTRFVE